MLSTRKGVISLPRPVTKGFYNQWLNDRAAPIGSTNIGAEDSRYDDGYYYLYTEARQRIGFPTRVKRCVP